MSVVSPPAAHYGVTQLTSRDISALRRHHHPAQFVTNLLITMPPEVTKHAAGVITTNCWKCAQHTVHIPDQIDT